MLATEDRNGITSHDQQQPLEGFLRIDSRRARVSDETRLRTPRHPLHRRPERATDTGDRTPSWIRCARRRIFASNVIATSRAGAISAASSSSYSQRLITALAESVDEGGAFVDDLFVVIWQFMAVYGSKCRTLSVSAALTSTQSSLKRHPPGVFSQTAESLLHVAALDYGKRPVQPISEVRVERTRTPHIGLVRASLASD